MTLVDANVSSLTDGNGTGNIVRVAPNEVRYCFVVNDFSIFYTSLTECRQLHFSNPAVYHEIFNQSTRWDKDPWIYHAFVEGNGSFGYLSAQEAKPRKATLQPVFSKQSILRMSDMIKSKVSYQPLRLTAPNPLLTGANFCVHSRLTGSVRYSLTTTSTVDHLIYFLVHVV